MDKFNSISIKEGILNNLLESVVKEYHLPKMEVRLKRDVIELNVFLPLGFQYLFVLKPAGVRWKDNKKLVFKVVKGTNLIKIASFFEGDFFEIKDDILTLSVSVLWSKLPSFFGSNFKITELNVIESELIIFLSKTT